ncbi:MAG: hypothetical protein R2749_30110 [Acidimicrobiales bacterium]
MGQPVITIEADDINAGAGLDRAARRRHRAEPEAVGDMGMAAYFTDSEGNLMGLWQSLGGA